MMLGGIKLQKEAFHITAGSGRLWITRGDQFSAVLLYAHCLLLVDDWVHNFVEGMNYWMNQGRRLLELRHWSPSSFLKYTIWNAVQFASRFEEVVADEARKRGADGPVCGHTHHAEMHETNRVLHYNEVDWVGSGNALIEYSNGQLEIVDQACIRQLPLR